MILVRYMFMLLGINVFNIVTCFVKIIFECREYVGKIMQLLINIK